MEILQKGLNSFQLKIIALIFMTLDHIAYFLSGILPIPNWFHLIGRLSAPIFIYMAASGFFYTHNRLSYMKRLYLGSVFMGIGNFIANRYFEHPLGAMVINNIFATIFYIVFFLYFLDKLKSAWKDKNKMQGILSIIMLLFPVILSFLPSILFSEVFLNIPGSMWILNFIMTFVPIPTLVEGSVFWILLGIGFYYCFENKKALSVFYILFSFFFLFTALENGFTIENLFFINNQWFMVFTLPLLLLYNKQRGRKMKYLFYIYYPLHVYLLLAIARLIA